MNNPPNMKGHIHIEYWVICSCGEGRPIDTHFLKPVKAAKEMGWILTKKKGWMCPSCQEMKRNQD